MEIDDLIEDLIEEELSPDDTFEMNLRTNATYEELPPKLVEKIAASSDVLSPLTTNEYLRECHVAATNLRHLFGDGEGMVAEYTSTILSNLTVLATEIRKDPMSFFFACLRTIDDPAEQDRLLSDAQLRLARFSAERS